MYKATASFPRYELFGLTSQMRRCSASISANIAEGSGRGTVPEFIRFLRMALGSANELERHLLLARDLNFIGPTSYEDLVGRAMELQRMLASLIRSRTPKVTGSGTKT